MKPLLSTHPKEVYPLGDQQDQRKNTLDCNSPQMMRPREEVASVRSMCFGRCVLEHLPCSAKYEANKESGVNPKDSVDRVDLPTDLPHLVAFHVVHGWHTGRANRAMHLS